MLIDTVKGAIEHEVYYRAVVDVLGYETITDKVNSARPVKLEGSVGSLCFLSKFDDHVSEPKRSNAERKAHRVVSGSVHPIRNCRRLGVDCSSGMFLTLPMLRRDPTLSQVPV